jgi:hypothetical protein
MYSNSVGLCYPLALRNPPSGDGGYEDYPVEPYGNPNGQTKRAPLLPGEKGDANSPRSPRPAGQSLAD